MPHLISRTYPLRRLGLLLQETRVSSPETCNLSCNRVTWGMAGGAEARGSKQRRRAEDPLVHGRVTKSVQGHGDLGGRRNVSTGPQWP